ncbi:MAG: preprotein translocase subunit SecD [Frankiales bacterium]|jgi:hypothetical protein|nr:preprotein translocase subunit SecD [Frankiales bacterium]
MDETTLTRTLRELASNPPLHPSPSADARRRASRLRRHRRTAAAGLVAIAAIGAFGVLQLQIGRESTTSTSSTSPSWRTNLTDPNNPNHATTGYIGLSRASGGQYVVYWQGRHLCFETAGGHSASTQSECSSVTPSAGTPMTVANIGADAMFVSVAPDVAYVDVRHPDGSGEGLSPSSADGFPYGVVVAQGKVMSLRARDKNGKQVGEAVAGPDALQIRQVLATFACSDPSRAGFDLTLPQAEDPKTCYGLAPIWMNFVPKLVQSVDDSARGWVVQVSLNAHDRTAFGQLTQRVATQSQPKNQLAIVLDGKLLSAAIIEQDITDGQFVVTGGTKAFDEQQAGYLAGEMSG